MPKMISNFQEFEGAAIRYSDSIEKGSPHPASSCGYSPVVQNTWTSDDSQKLSEQMYGVKHPWTREQYEKLADPDVKRDISYDAYLNMWDSESRKSLSELDKKPKPKTNPFKSKSTTKPQNTYTQEDLEKLVDKARLITENDPKYKEIVDYARPIIINNHVHDEAKGWKSIRIETRIMIVTMIIGVILSFMTVLILILK